MAFVRDRRKEIQDTALGKRIVSTVPADRIILASSYKPL